MAFHHAFGIVDYVKGPVFFADITADLPRPMDCRKLVFFVGTDQDHRAVLEKLRSMLGDIKPIDRP